MLTRARLLAGVLLIFSLFLPLPAEALQRPEGEAGGALPEGKGKELVGSVCAQCHALNTVTTQKRSMTEWEQIVGRMIASGAQLSPEEAKTIAAYLGENFGLESKPAAAGASSSSEAAGGGGREGGTGFPDGSGKEMVMNKCFQCHAASMWRDLKQDRKKWEGTLYRMVGKGALWTEEEISTMAQYLGTAFGPKASEPPQRRQK